MKYSKNQRLFLRITAIYSLLGALTTVLLIFLPGPVTNGFEEAVLLSKNKMYLSKLWILFIHPQVNFIASLGIAFILYKKYPFQISLGLLFLFIWCYAEMSQQALSIDALNQIWRPSYLNASENDQRVLFKTLIEGFKGIWDSQYFMVIYGFGLGTLFFGLALIQEEAIAKWIGISMVFIGALSLLSFIRYYLGFGFLSIPIDWVYKWIYPYLQPLLRVLIGIWIFSYLKIKK